MNACQLRFKRDFDNSELGSKPKGSCASCHHSIKIWDSICISRLPITFIRADHSKMWFLQIGLKDSKDWKDQRQRGLIICKLSTFNQNVGGGDDTPMMDGWMAVQHPKGHLASRHPFDHSFEYKCQVMLCAGGKMIKTKMMNCDVGQIHLWIAVWLCANFAKNICGSIGKGTQRSSYLSEFEGLDWPQRLEQLKLIARKLYTRGSKLATL